MTTDLQDLPLFRQSNPATSRAAAEASKKFRGEHERRILEALELGPAHRDEIARRSGLEQSAVWRRLAALERRGEIERTGEVARGESGMKQGVYRITAASR